jgi:hypothetical protein
MRRDHRLSHPAVDDPGNWFNNVEVVTVEKIGIGIEPALSHFLAHLGNVGGRAASGLP